VAGDGDGLFEPFERLLPVRILGREAQIPERNSWLRGLQFLDREEVALGDFCWNGDCRHCESLLRRRGEERWVLCCQTEAEAGDELVEVPPEVAYALRRWRKGPGGERG
jgi:hypothetical protein